MHTTKNTHKTLGGCFVALLLFCAGPALADGHIETFRGCAEAVDSAEVKTAYRECTAEIMKVCAASKTAGEAVDCFDNISADLLVEAELDLSNLSEKRQGEVLPLMMSNRESGQGACGLLAHNDKKAGATEAQIAVNQSFCQMMVMADLLGQVINQARITE
ncbi:MAG: hypothetical protein ACPGGK_13885 [Pikeienuella sp.]